MEKSAETISDKKFLRLSLTSRNRVLAELCQKALNSPSAEPIESRYLHLLNLAEIDGLTGTDWLDPRERWSARLQFHSSLGRLAAPKGPQTTSPWIPSVGVTVILESIISPYNLGSIFRIIDNFGWEGVISTNLHLSPSHPQCRKSARETQTWIPFQQIKDLPAFLDERKRPLIALEITEKAVPLDKWNPPPSFDLVLGNETFGVSKYVLGRADQHVYIPMQGFKRSMNVTHACACLAMWLQAQLKNPVR